MTMTDLEREHFKFPEGHRPDWDVKVKPCPDGCIELRIHPVNGAPVTARFNRREALELVSYLVGAVRTAS